MSFVLPPPPPLMVYPNTVSASPPSHSKGSFGMVFIVLAVIVILSAIACILGRLCSRRSSQPKPRRETQDQPKPRRDSQDHTFQPKPRRESKDHTFNPKPRRESQDPTFHPKEGDLEFGFKGGIPTSKPTVNGGRKDSIPGYSFGTKEDIKAAEYGGAKESM